MKLIDALKKMNRKQRCTRCKKVIQGSEYKQIGEDCFDIESAAAEEKIFPERAADEEMNFPESAADEEVNFPEYLLLRTPSILKDGAQVKTLTCPICKKETPNPFFHSSSQNASPYFYTWFGEHRLCYLCARKQVLALKEPGDEARGKNYFFYPVSDSNAEKSYWDNAVTEANNERQRNKLKEPPEFFEMVDHTIICEYDNPNNEDMMDDNTSLYIYANSRRTLWCFKLVNDYISGWDGWPVWMGGFITPEQFLEFMDKMQLKHHLFLFEKEKV